jgi:RNA-binding protein
MKKLTPKQRQFLRGLGHELTPHVQIAGFPLGEGTRKEVETQLERHELIKIKVSVDERDERREGIAALAESLKAQLVQEIGKTALLYRYNPERKDPLQLPKA